jgi:hypothetical protein
VLVVVQVQEEIVASLLQQQVVVEQVMVQAQEVQQQPTLEVVVEVEALVVEMVALASL